MSKLQASASKSALLLACPRPFEVDIGELEESSEPARYGSAFHEIIAACLRSKALLFESTSAYAKAVDKAVKRYDMKPAAQELAGHVKSSVKVLRNWLAREKLEIAVIETAYAIRPSDSGSWSVRAIESFDEDHRYGVDEGEVPGTVDLVVRNSHRTRSVTIDHKTGMQEDWYNEGADFARPVKLAQMRTLGLVGTRAAELRVGAGARTSEVAIFYADRMGLPYVYVDPYELDEKQEHVRALYAALEILGRGFFRHGPHCQRCPINNACPAYTAQLLSEGTVALVKHATTFALEPIDPKALHVLPDDSPLAGASVEERAGALYELIKRFDVLAAAGREEIRRLVKAGAVIETADGRSLALRTQTFETLSKKSVLEALGSVAGEKELARLRKKGVIRESTREQLVQEK